MAFCDDPALTYLNRIGYNVIRLPRTGMDPLQVLGCERGKSPEPLGTLRTVWSSQIAVPPVQEGDAASVSGQSTNEIKLSVGLKILEGVLGAMGASVPQVKTSYSRAKTVRFEFKDPQIRKIDPLIVGNYLAAGDLKDNNPVVERYLFEDQTQAFIVTEVLYSKSIRVVALESSSVGAEVDVKAVQDSIGANVDVKSNSSDEGDLVYTGKSALAFGYKAHEIAFDGVHWSVRRLYPSKDGALLADAKIEPAPPVLFGGPEFWGGAR